MTADTLQTRARELYDQGRRTAYAEGYNTNTTPEQATHLNICLGEQWSGKRLYLLDLDGPSHGPSFDADAAKAAFEAERPELATKLDWYPSRSETGWNALFESSVQIPTGKLYDQANNHIGELLGADTDRTLDPGDVRIPCLHIGEIERLLNVWHVQSSSPKGERWADRAKQGAQWTRGAQHIPVTRARLRTFLQNDAGQVGKSLDALFDLHKPFNRSDAAGTLMQNLMFFARKLPGCANAPFTTVCANVKAYWMASDSFGKAGDKGYNQDKDGDSLIAQIANGDPFGPTDDAKRWRIPHWVTGAQIPAHAPEPAPEAPRPAHRPAGDRAKQITRLKRLLTYQWEATVTGKFFYFVDDLDDWAGRCGVSRRSIQSYLTDLETDGQITRGQESGRAGGRPWMQIEPAFFGMQVTPEEASKAVPEPDKNDAVWNADQIAVLRSTTPQSAETTCNAKEDHQNTCEPSAPTRQPLDELVARDQAALAEMWQGLRPLPAEQRRARQKRFIPYKAQHIDGRYSVTNHGEAPAPTPHREKLRPPPLESLPEPPAAAAPAGAQGAGVPLPSSLVERLRQLKADRQQALL